MARQLKLKLHDEPKGRGDNEPRYRFRFSGRIIDDSKRHEGAVGRALQQIFRGAARKACLSRGNRPMAGTGVFKPKPHELTQRVVAKTTWARNTGTAMRAHGAYMERYGEQVKGFDASRDEMSPKDELAGWSAERNAAGQRTANFTKLMLSPQRELEPEQLREFARESMAEIERDLGRKLRWCAAVHIEHDKHPHVHIAIHGRDALGRALRIDPKYAHQALGLRSTVAEVLTKQIGQRTEADIAKDRKVNRADRDELKRRLRGAPQSQHRIITMRHKAEVAERKKREREAEERRMGIAPDKPKASAPARAAGTTKPAELSQDEQRIQSRLTSLRRAGITPEQLAAAEVQLRRVPSKATATPEIVAPTKPKATPERVNTTSDTAKRKAMAGGADKTKELTPAEQFERDLQARLAKIPEHQRAAREKAARRQFEQAAKAVPPQR